MISLSPAKPEEREALRSLMQLYAYDWSEIVPLDVAENGRFVDYPLDAYFRDVDHHPFLLRVEGTLAGFALVTERSRLTGTAGVFDMEEFFVMRRYRRKGVGQEAATAAFDRFRGPWEVRQRETNTAATSFWRRVIRHYTRGEYEEIAWDDAAWRGPVQRFTSSPSTIRS